MVERGAKHRAIYIYVGTYESSLRGLEREGPVGKEELPLSGGYILVGDLDKGEQRREHGENGENGEREGAEEAVSRTE